MGRDASIVLAGAAGQGIETVAGMLSSILKQSGYYVFVTREFMSRIRGGTNSLQLRVSDTRVGAYSRNTDIAIPLNKSALPHLRKYDRIQGSTIIIGEEEFLERIDDHDEDRVISVGFTDIAKNIGKKLYSNTVAAGLIAAFFDVDEDLAIDYLKERFGEKGEDIIQKNIEAYQKGQEEGKKLAEQKIIKFDMAKTDAAKKELLLSGTDGVALGAIAGGCNFIASYPMSPSTGVLTFLADQSQEFGILVDQTEDEISAINKGVGAWYAGARAMVTTSGGGFALMTEGLSLAGMMESPMVIHLAQRPGPATGLPTRSGQEDLMHALNAAHGEFPRIIFSPGTPEDAFYLTQGAFNLAAKFQVPVIILTDQFLVDSSGNASKLLLDDLQVLKHIVKTDKDYKRYRLTEEGISPRGIPGHGEGIVVADSDEHDEEGHITEDLHLREKMVDKRLKKKYSLIRDAALPPIIDGPETYSKLVIVWGSNYLVAKEAVEKIGRDDVAVAYFRQVYPLSDNTEDLFKDIEQVCIIENNATGQFARLLHSEINFWIPEDGRFLKYNGLPFAVEEVVEFLSNYFK
ncbi:MAG: 2-oxoacid:ferredoxin oxidoreductase subunit alpha [Candidatus Thorarchaeota archaeon]|nr:MAG: 2-oxoacid:ferredoxin oxidoreductase subunit alpha [Candidatus Thorarchaeota archaeon]